MACSEAILLDGPTERLSKISRKSFEALESIEGELRELLNRHLGRNFLFLFNLVIFSENKCTDVVSSNLFLSRSYIRELIQRSVYKNKIELDPPFWVEGFFIIKKKIETQLFPIPVPMRIEEKTFKSISASQKNYRSPPNIAAGTAGNKRPQLQQTTVRQSP